MTVKGISIIILCFQKGKKRIYKFIYDTRKMNSSGAKHVVQSWPPGGKAAQCGGPLRRD